MVMIMHNVWLIRVLNEYCLMAGMHSNGSSMLCGTPVCALISRGLLSLLTANHSGTVYEQALGKSGCSRDVRGVRCLHLHVRTTQSQERNPIGADESRLSANQTP